MVKKEKLQTVFSYLCGGIEVIVFLSILLYIFINGTSILSFKLITSDYHEKVYSLKKSDSIERNQFIDLYNSKNNDTTFVSKKYGIILKNTKDLEGNSALEIVYIDSNSPIKSMNFISNSEKFILYKGYMIQKVLGKDMDNKDVLILPQDGAEKAIEKLDSICTISNLTLKTQGGGIRGSLLNTLITILITLIISIPLGVFCAITLTFYINNKIIKGILERMIELTNGIPSIIFGFIGMVIFIPLVSLTLKTSGGNIITASLTLTILLLPTIIKTVQEQLKTIPKSWIDSSYALGANKTKTLNRIILPNSLPGIISACILSIGRIIGESAALIYSMGTYISDTITLNKRSTTLAVHIWTIMGGDNPKYDFACAISIIILLIVFFLCMIVKLLNYKGAKKYGTNI